MREYKQFFRLPLHACGIISWMLKSCAREKGKRMSASANASLLYNEEEKNIHRQLFPRFVPPNSLFFEFPPIYVFSVPFCAYNILSFGESSRRTVAVLQHTNTHPMVFVYFPLYGNKLKKKEKKICFASLLLDCSIFSFDLSTFVPGWKTWYSAEKSYCPNTVRVNYINV